MPEVKITVKATIDLIKTVHFDDKDWDEVKGDHDLLASYVDSTQHDTFEMTAKEFKAVEIIKG